MTHYCDESCTSDNCMARLRAELATEREARQAAERQRDEQAAALERQAAKCRLWRDTFEGLDQDLFSVEAFHDLSAIYDLTDDADAQDTASAILSARDAEQRRKGAAWALNQIPCTCSVDRLTGYTRKCQRCCLCQINEQRGEVEVPAND